MNLDANTCYRALLARDSRFDGLFYVGVATTGIYCRPVCTARTPGRDRCSFFRTAAEAERADYRACFRCRPELAPGMGPMDALSRLSSAAVDRIQAGYLNDGSVDELAAELGVTGRHLRRTMVTELGVSPVDLAQARRLALAKQLLHDTGLSLAEVAFASGFSSVRRFNGAFQDRFGRAPSALRKEPRARSSSDTDGSVVLRLDHRPPFAWEPLLAFLAARATPGVERVEDGVYRRTVRIGERRGWIAVRRDAVKPAILAEVSLSLTGAIMPLSARLRGLFDLDAHPEVVAAHLGADPVLGPIVAARPGLRLPGAFDPFETSARAVLGQQVSVRAATTLSGRLAEALGEATVTPIDGLTRLFPSPEQVVAAGDDAVAAIGMPLSRARALVGVARFFVERPGVLARGADPDLARSALVALPGIGPWTAEYLAMRVLGWPDALPASDLALRKALDGASARAVEERAQAWRPFRSYAALHLWTHAGATGATGG